MKRIIFALTLLPILWSCNTNDKSMTIEGDLYFKLIDVFKVFDANDSTINKIEQTIKSNKKDSLPENERLIYDKFEVLMDHDLLRKPFIRIRLDNGELKMLFLNNSDYKKFIDYNLMELNENNQKIRINAKVTEITLDKIVVYNTIELILVDKMTGNTEFEK